MGLYTNKLLTGGATTSSCNLRESVSWVILYVCSVFGLFHYEQTHEQNMWHATSRKCDFINMSFLFPLNMLKQQENGRALHYQLTLKVRFCQQTYGFTNQNCDDQYKLSMLHDSWCYCVQGGIA